MKTGIYYITQKIFVAYKGKDRPLHLADNQPVTLTKVTFSPESISNPSSYMRMCCCCISC
jgi:hypothetical protein